MTKNKIKALLLALCLMLPTMFMLTSCGHKHTYAEAWSNNETNHWHACTGEKCDETKDNGKHTFITKNNDTSHWQECSDCGYKKDISGHIYGATTIKSPANYGTNMQTTHTCSVCNHVEDLTVENSGSEYTGKLEMIVQNTTKVSNTTGAIIVITCYIVSGTVKVGDNISLQTTTDEEPITTTVYPVLEIEKNREIIQFASQGDTVSIRITEPINEEEAVNEAKNRIVKNVTCSTADYCSKFKATITNLKKAPIFNNLQQKIKLYDGKLTHTIKITLEDGSPEISDTPAITPNTTASVIIELIDYEHEEIDQLHLWSGLEFTCYETDANTTTITGIITELLYK